jgi:hypothetical protein
MKAFFSLLALALLPLVAFAQNDAPPTELFSPDKKFSVRMLDSALPGADPDTGDQTLAVVAGGKVINKLPATGYFINALWSPDGKFVAVNDRRANSGDYLWVISLSDGKAVRTPDDNDVQPFVDRIVAKFPSYKSASFFKRLTEGVKWKGTNELVMKTTLSFEKDDRIFILTDTCKAEDGKLMFESGQIEKKASSVPMG